jgi:hypothetical protein
LLKIGLWEEARAFWKDKYTHEQFQRKLLDSYVPRLGPKMGSIYGEVMRMLLNMELNSEETDKQRNQGYMEIEARSEGYWRIVRELEKCSA